MTHDQSNDPPNGQRPRPEAETSEQPVRSSEDPTIVSGRIPTGIPKRIGSYHLKRLIGSGGMGSVYEAQQEQPRRRVALKIMKAGVTSKSAHRRFEAEAQLLARLRHTGIAQVYEAGTYESEGDSIPYFAMEYIANAKNLIEYARLKDLDTKERLELFTQVCEAVQHGHQKGIIHRDLKPDNILVDSSGQIKIIDFGVARATDADMVVTTLQTDVGQIIGTLQYMSPEQCEADPSDLDTRSDVYALGVVLYELLCQQLPYDLSRAAMYEAVRIIRETPPTHPSTINTRLRGDVETIALKALEKERDRRYQSAADLGKDIQRFLHSEPIEARRASVAYQLSMMARRNKPLFAAAAAIVIGLSVAAIGATWGWTSAETAKEQAIAAKNEADRQKAEATKQRDLAQTRFDDVRSLARLFMNEFHEEIKELDGSTPAKELLASSALEYLEKLRNDAGDNQDLLEEVADGYAQLGVIYGGLGDGNLARHDDALRQHRNALQLRRQLADASPDDFERKLLVVQSHYDVGGALSSKKLWSDALNEYRTGQAIAEELLDIDGEDAAVLQRYGRVLQKIGDMHSKLGEKMLAKAFFDKALTVKRDVLRLDPDDRTARRDLSTVQIRIGHWHQNEEDHAEAVQWLDEALRIREELDREESTGRSQRDLIWARYYKCGAALGLRLYDEARDLIIDAFESSQVRMENDPRNKRAASDFETMYNLALHVARIQDGNDAFKSDCLKRVRRVLQTAHNVDPMDAATKNKLDTVDAELSAIEERMKT